MTFRYNGCDLRLDASPEKNPAENWERKSEY